MDLIDLFNDTRSIRKFDGTKKISKEKLFLILDSQKYAARCFNAQRLTYLIVTNEKKVCEITQNSNWAALLKDDSLRPSGDDMPCSYIVVLTNAEDKSAEVQIDFGLAISYIRLTATNQGISSCILTNINRKSIRDILNIDYTKDIHSIIAMGYPKCESDICYVDDKDLTYSVKDNRWSVNRMKTEDLVKYYD